MPEPGGPIIIVPVEQLKAIPGTQLGPNSNHRPDTVKLCPGYHFQLFYWDYVIGLLAPGR